MRNPLHLGVSGLTPPSQRVSLLPTFDDSVVSSTRHGAFEDPDSTRKFNVADYAPLVNQSTPPSDKDTHDDCATIPPRPRPMTRPAPSSLAVIEDRQGHQRTGRRPTGISVSPKDHAESTSSKQSITAGIRDHACEASSKHLCEILTDLVSQSACLAREDFAFTLKTLVSCEPGRPRYKSFGRPGEDHSEAHSGVKRHGRPQTAACIASVGGGTCISPNTDEFRRFGMRRRLSCSHIP
ncbi:hypothetical protein GGR54DRAFT_105296 [Hypoxylon sp. NC1633]|nr:hypothetical protein GGR54DRAFT_105296 [Hypoxylon sp. NC1633]